MKRVLIISSVIVAVLLVCWLILRIDPSNDQPSTMTHEKRLKPSAEKVTLGDSDPFGDSGYYYYGKIRNHENRSVQEILNSGKYLSLMERKKGFESFLNTGVFYPLRDSLRPMYLEFPDLQLPYIELRLKTRDGAGNIVAFDTLTSVSFRWISEDYDFTAAEMKQDQDGFSNQFSGQNWSESVISNGGILTAWRDEHRRIVQLRNVRINKEKNLPYGVRSIRVPVLPANLDELYPEIAKKLWKHRSIPVLRCGEWYQVNIFLRFEDMADSPNHPLEGDYFPAFFKVPDAERVKMGKILPVDLLVVPNLFPPFDPTVGYSKDRIAKGEHTIPRPRYITVQVAKEITARYPRLKLFYIDRLASNGMYRLYDIKDGEAEVKVFKAQAGDLLLIQEALKGDGGDVLFAVRNIHYKRNIVRFPDDADYVRSNPNSYTIDLKDRTRNSTKSITTVQLALGLKDVGYVEMAIIENGYAKVSVNPGKYFVQVQFKDLSYEVIGTVVLPPKGAGNLMVQALSAQEEREWSEFKSSTQGISKRTVPEKPPKILQNRIKPENKKPETIEPYLIAPQ